MANENLQNAIQQAGLTVEGFAEVIKVDPKSVQRWVTGATIPYPRHRESIALALNMGEHELWPEHTPAPEPEPDEIVVEGCDVVGTWGHADDPTAPDLPSFLFDTAGPVDVLDSSCAVQITTEVTDMLLVRAASGDRVRILTDGREPHWEPLLAQSNIEVFLCEIPGEHWLIKTTDRMLLAINLEHDPAGGPSPPLLLLHPATSDGLFDRLTQRFGELWKLTGEITPAASATPDSSGTGLEERDRQPRQGPRQAAAPGPGGSGRRRWPRQPN